MTDFDPVIAWLLASDPSIRWQAMRDLLDAPEAEWAAERARVEAEGWGARLLSCQDEDGQWAGGAFVPAGFDARAWAEEGQPWTATSFALSQLREFGLDPASDRARRTVALIGANSRWDEGGQRYWDGKVEECINGRTVADGAYFGVDVASIVERLVGGRLATAAGTASGSTARCGRPFTARSTCWRGCWSTRGQPAARLHPRTRGGRARRTCFGDSSSAVWPRESRRTSGFSGSVIRTAGGMTCCGGSTISALPRW